jgi:hypothetical protein
MYHNVEGPCGRWLRLLCARTLTARSLIDWRNVTWPAAAETSRGNDATAVRQHSYCDRLLFFHFFTLVMSTCFLLVLLLFTGLYWRAQDSTSSIAIVMLIVCFYNLLLLFMSDYIFLQGLPFTVLASEVSKVCQKDFMNTRLMSLGTRKLVHLNYPFKLLHCFSRSRVRCTSTHVFRQARRDVWQAGKVSLATAIGAYLTFRMTWVRFPDMT